jgi:hypothetical protein
MLSRSQPPVQAYPAGADHFVVGRAPAGHRGGPSAPASAGRRYGAGSDAMARQASMGCCATRPPPPGRSPPRGSSWYGCGREADIACGRDKPNVGLPPYPGRVSAHSRSFSTGLLATLSFAATTRWAISIMSCCRAAVAGRWSSQGSRGYQRVQGLDAPEVEPHTPPHAAQTASGGTNPPERGQSPPFRACGPTSG